MPGCSVTWATNTTETFIGDGDPFSIINKYDKQFLLEYEKTNGFLSSSSSSSSLALNSLQDYVLYDNKKLLNYGRFFYLNKFTIRNFKFTTTTNNVNLSIDLVIIGWLLKSKTVKRTLLVGMKFQLKEIVRTIIMGWNGNFPY